jgi:hypothetical protein
MKKTTAPIPFAGSQLDQTRRVCAFFNKDDKKYLFSFSNIWLWVSVKHN